MSQFLLIIQIIICIGLIGTIAIQAKGSGLSGAFGGSGEMYRSRKGIEKGITYATVVLTVLFALVSVALLLLA